MTETKKDITRANLEVHDISYVEKVYSGDDELVQDGSLGLPDHVDAVREMLLRFEGLIPEDWRQDLNDEFEEYKSDIFDPTSSLRPPTSAFFRPKYTEDADPGPEFKAVRVKLKTYARTAEEARGLYDNPEAGWCHFWRSELFKTFTKKDDTQRGHFAILDAWSLEQDVAWNEFPTWEPSKKHPVDRTQPKPDLTYAFPILKKGSEPLKGFERDEFTRCFSLEILGELRKNNILSAPTTGLNRWLKDPNTRLWSKDYSCFPWAVVEMKRDDETMERCYCQAANAAAAAVTLHAQLLEKSFGDSSSLVPPVIAFTTVGPNVKVWLAYQTSDNSGRQLQRMVCIWGTSVRLTWGVMALHAIVMNMHIWAARILKPKISAWITQAYRKLPPSTPREPKTPASRKPKTPASRTAKTPTLREPTLPKAGKQAISTSQSTPVILSNSSEINTPSSSSYTPLVSDWPALQSAASSPSRRPQNRSPVFRQTPPLHLSSYPFPESSTVAQPVPRIAPSSLSWTPFTSTPKSLENITSMNSPFVTLNESNVADIKGKEHSGPQAAVSELYEQVEIDEITRLLDSSTLANSALKNNDGSINCARDNLDSKNELKPVSGSQSAANSKHSVRLNGDELHALVQSRKVSGPDLNCVETGEDTTRSNKFELGGESGEDLDNDSEFELEEIDNDPEYEPLNGSDNDSDDDSDDDSDNDSDNDSELEDDTERSCVSEEEINDSQNPRSPIHVSEEDINAWRRQSLQALSGKQIAEMPIISRLFWRISRAEWMATIQKELEVPSINIYSRNMDALEKLLSHLNLFLEPSRAISTDAFQGGQADPHIFLALQNAQTTGIIGYNSWLCFKYAISCWPGYKCVKALSVGLGKLIVEELKKMEIDAFAILNGEDQDCELLR